MPAPSEDLAGITARHDIYPGIDPKPLYDAQAYKGKVVFIAGASRGIGAEIALTYARAGASLILSARNHATLESLKVTISKETPNVPVLTVSADVTNVKQVKAAVDAAIAKFGKIDTVIANAGRADAWDKPIAKDDPERWWQTFEVNMRGVFNVAHVTLPYLDKTKGYLVIVSSGAAQFRIPFASDYCVSKHAVVRFNEFVAMEHPDVKSFAVHPGSIKTDTSMNNPAWEPYMIDSPRLPAATALRLTTGKDNYLSGRFVSCNWDLDEVEKNYKEKIVENAALVSRLAVPM